MPFNVKQRALSSSNINAADRKCTEAFAASAMLIDLKDEALHHAYHDSTVLRKRQDREPKASKRSNDVIESRVEIKRTTCCVLRILHPARLRRRRRRRGQTATWKRHKAHRGEQLRRRNLGFVILFFFFLAGTDDHHPGGRAAVVRVALRMAEGRVAGMMLLRVLLLLLLVVVELRGHPACMAPAEQQSR